MALVALIISVLIVERVGRRRRKEAKQKHKREKKGVGGIWKRLKIVFHVWDWKPRKPHWFVIFLFGLSLFFFLFFPFFPSSPLLSHISLLSLPSSLSYFFFHLLYSSSHLIHSKDWAVFLTVGNIDDTHTLIARRLFYVPSWTFSIITTTITSSNSSPHRHLGKGIWCHTLINNSLRSRYHQKSTLTDRRKDSPKVPWIAPPLPN